MAMTRKHYEELAQRYAQVLKLYEDDFDATTVLRTANAAARHGVVRAAAEFAMLAKNERDEFDVDRFMAAVGVHPWEYRTEVVVNVKDLTLCVDCSRAFDNGGYDHHVRCPRCFAFAPTVETTNA